MTIEEIADEINAHGSSFHLSALGTVDGDKWTCEIIGFKWPEMSSSHICEEFRATPEVERLREALVKIASFDPAQDQGYIDEWQEAGAFNMCQDIARKAIEGVTGVV